MLYECSNNTNKLSPQERYTLGIVINYVQIIQINLVLKNLLLLRYQQIFGSNNTNKLSPQEHEIKT